MKRWHAARLGTALFGVCLAALGTYIGIETTQMNAGPSYAAVGPRAFPGAIAIGLLLIGALQLWNAIRHTKADAQAPQHDWPAVIWIGAALIVQMLALRWVGWIPAATLVFVGVARAFGSRRWARDALIGLALAGGTFVLFNHVLDLDLPVGEWFAPTDGR